MEKTIRLTNIAGYSEKWKLHRNTVTKLMGNGGLTVYETPKGKRLLNSDEVPPKETLVRSMDAENK